MMSGVENNLSLRIFIEQNTPLWCHYFIDPPDRS